jgi:hypothetical protein
VSADQPKRCPLAEGAARAAPTAPHATPRTDRRRLNGPERFWTAWRTRVALAVGLVVSAALHLSPMMPVVLLERLEVNEIEGNAAIPVDLLANDEPAEAPPPPPPAEPEAPGEKPAEARRPPLPDAGPIADAAIPDAAADGAPRDAGAADAGAVDAAPLDPAAINAMIHPEAVPIELHINAEVIRKHPLGSHLGVLLKAIPQWNDFMGGTALDPINDVDWILISGPSFINTSRDAVMVRFSASASEAALSRDVAVVASKYARGGPFDAGVPGMKATLAYADRSERVILRPAPRVLVVVPPKDAASVARQLAGARVPAHLHPGDALFWRFAHPHLMLRELPDAITEMRLRIVPRADGSADILAEGDVPDAESAVSAAADVARFARRRNDMLTSLVTHGLFDGVEVRADGKLVKAHLTASLDQIEAVLALVSGLLGVNEAPAGSASSPLRPPGAPSAAPWRGPPGGPH